jgi:hypothetical protein
MKPLSCAAFLLLLYSGVAFPSSNDVERFSKRDAALKEITALTKTMYECHSDLLETGKSIKGWEKEINLDLFAIVSEYDAHLDHVVDLMGIDISILNESEATRRNIESQIRESFSKMKPDIDLTVKQINLYISGSKNQNTVAIATKIRESLRGIKNWLTERERELGQ